MKKIKISGFTLIEMMVTIVLFSLTIVMVFQVMWNMTWFRLKNIMQLDLDNDLFYAIENLTTTIKDFDWKLDYEEYWNRSSLWTSTSSWHYDKFTWYWNYGYNWDLVNNSSYWDYFYFCRSWNNTNMWTWWCLNNVFNTYNTPIPWSPQRYWQYAFEFIDYNSNMNNDWWNEDLDWSWNIRWDDDDENIWEWPAAFTWDTNIKELYLYKKWRINERLFLRLNYKLDPRAPSSATCNSDWTWSWCLWNIQILKLVWRDYWSNHIVSWTWVYDWVIDTWECATDFNCNWTNNLPKNLDDWWIDILPEYINVKDLKIFAYPNKDYKLAWKEDNIETNLNPYIRLNIKLWFSWDRRKLIKNNDPTINISTTINLSSN